MTVLISILFSGFSIVWLLYSIPYTWSIPETRTKDLIEIIYVNEDTTWYIAWDIVQKDDWSYIQKSYLEQDLSEYRTHTSRQDISWLKKSNRKKKDVRSTWTDLSDIPEEIIIWLASSTSDRKKRALQEILPIINTMYSNHTFILQEMEYRDRAFHDIWIRKNYALEVSIPWESKIPDDSQWFIFSHNSHYKYSPQEPSSDTLHIQNKSRDEENKQKILLFQIWFFHEFIVTVSPYLGVSRISKLDTLCNRTWEYTEDASPLPGMARTFSACHYWTIKRMLFEG